MMTITHHETVVFGENAASRIPRLREVSYDELVTTSYQDCV